MQDPLQPTILPPKSSTSPSTARTTEDDPDVDMEDAYELVPSDDDSFGSDFDALTEADDIPDILDTTEKPPSYSPFAATPTSLDPPPSSSRNVLQKLRKSEEAGMKPPSYPRQLQGGMCVICKVRPMHNNGQEIFPTCGKTCAQKLEAASIPQSTIMQGHMSNPFSHYNTRSASSNHPSSNNHSAWLIQSSRPPQIKMCEVCHVRPRCERGGKIYPTCGLTCASKLHPTVEMCDFCKQRPKVVLNGKTYPQCGKTCRDNARLAAAAASSATCRTCLACWKAEMTQENGDICSPACRKALEGRAPILVEVPRGHAAFKKVMNAFEDSWKKSRTSRPSPRVKKIFMIYQKAEARAKSEQYRKQVNSRALFQRKPAGQISWLGTPRECGFGDPGNMEPCSSNKCLLCSIVRSSISQERFPEGIMTTQLLPRAIETASNVRKRSSKVVMLASVALGSVLETSDLRPPFPPVGYDSVHLIAYSNFGKRMDFGENLVFDAGAIRPQYLISFE